MCGFIAQLVEHCTGMAEVTGLNPVEALIFFFRLLLSDCLNWKIYCDDHSLLTFIYCSKENKIKKNMLSNFASESSVEVESQGI